MSQRAACLQALRLPQDLAKEDCTHAISELITLVASGQSHSVSLNDVHDAISRYDFAVHLEPLDVLPPLLPCRRDGAMDMIRLCASHSSPKEIMIVLQEAIESLQAYASYEDEEEENNSDLVQRAMSIVLLCSPAISRSKLGKRSALELCSPVLENVTSLILSISPLVTRDEGRMLITEVAALVRSLSLWASAVADASGPQETKRLLRELLDVTVVSCAPSIQASLAIRAAQTHFPRLFLPTAEEGWQDGKGAMAAVELALEGLGDTPGTASWKPNKISDLVYLAHSTTPLPLSTSSLPDLHHLLLGVLQMNMILDEALVLLFKILTDENASLSPEIATSLCTAFTALASTHLDPIIRQLNLRLLSLTLSKLPPSPRLEMLLALTKDEDFPQIRGPAVALVKEAVLEALAVPPDHMPRNPFASPELLRIFGAVLFRPNPSEFFSEKKTREELSHSLELLRIADCLSFYYVLLQRDHENRTGVRSKGNVKSMQSSILHPLRRFLNEHMSGEEPPLMAVLSLQVGLDRIDSALRTFDLDKNT